MGQTIVEIAFVTGFFSCWVGFATLLLPMIFRGVFSRDYWESLSLSYRERVGVNLQRMNREFLRCRRSRAGRIGQILIAFGLSLLILTGLLWLTLRLIDKQGLLG